VIVLPLAVFGIAMVSGSLFYEAWVEHVYISRGDVSMENVVDAIPGKNGTNLPKGQAVYSGSRGSLNKTVNLMLPCPNCGKLGC